MITKYVIPTTIVGKFDANAPVNLGPTVELKSGGKISRYMTRKARLKSYQKVRWDQIVAENEKFNLGSTDRTHKKYAASATIKKLVSLKKNFGSENRTQKTDHRRPQPRNGRLKEKFGVRKSEPKNIHRRPQPCINGGLKEKFGVRRSDSKIKITALNFIAV